MSRMSEEALRTEYSDLYEMGGQAFDISPDLFASPDYISLPSDPSMYNLLNPESRDRASDLWNLFSGMGGAGGYADLMSGIGALIGQIAGFRPEVDAGAGLSAFMKAAPRFKELASGAGQDWRALADAQTARAQEQTLAKLAGMGQTWSGAGAEELYKAGLIPQLEAATNIAGMESGLLNTLYGSLPSMISTYPSTQLGQQELALNALLGGISGYGTQANMFGNLLSALGPSLEPQWAAPTILEV